MKGKILFAFILSLILFLGNKLSYSAADPVVASVNGTDIKQSELEQNFTQSRLYVSDKLVTKAAVLDDLINRVLGIQRAKKNNLQNNEIVKNKMEDVLYHAQISKDLESALQKIVVNDDEVKKYYNEHKEYRTAHILLRVRAEPSKAEYEEAQNQAFKISDTLKKNPDDFPELANKFSQISSAPNGGDVGFQPAVNLAPEYFLAIKDKPVGHITQPVRTQFGYHIIKILGIKDFKEIDVPYYKQLIFNAKRDDILKSYFLELRKNQKITINKEFLK